VKVLFVELGPGGGSHHEDLERRGAGLAQDLDLIQKAVVAFGGIQRLGIVVHHHRHRADAVGGKRVERFDGLVDALALVDERGSHVLDTEPQGAAAGVVDRLEMVLHLQRVMDSDFGSPADFSAQFAAIEVRLGQGFDDFERAGFVIEKIVVGARRNNAGRTHCSDDGIPPRSGRRS